jgi:hypothetical protein
VGRCDDEELSSREIKDFEALKACDGKGKKNYRRAYTAAYDICGPRGPVLGCFG